MDAIEFPLKVFLFFSLLFTMYFIDLPLFLLFFFSSFSFFLRADLSQNINFFDIIFISYVFIGRHKRPKFSIRLIETHKVIVIIILWKHNVVIYTMHDVEMSMNENWSIKIDQSEAVIGLEDSPKNLLYLNYIVSHSD